MRDFAVRELKHKASTIFAIGPIFYLACMTFLALALWEEIADGFIPNEIYGFGIAFGVAALIVQLAIGQSLKNIYFDLTKKMLYVTRPYSLIAPRKKNVIGFPESLEIQLKHGEDRSFLVLRIETRANRKIRLTKIRFELEEQEEVVRRIEEATGVPVAVPSILRKAVRRL